MELRDALRKERKGKENKDKEKSKLGASIFVVYAMLEMIHGTQDQISRGRSRAFTQPLIRYGG